MCINHAIRVIASLGLFLSLDDLILAGQHLRERGRQSPVPVIVDVALHADGELRGQVVDQQGVAKRGVVVSVYQANKKVSSTVSRKGGFFSIEGLRGGLYVLSAGGSQKAFRLWKGAAAPPSSQRGVLLVAGTVATRGQFKFFRSVRALAILGGTAIGFGIYESTLDDKPPAS